MNSVMNAIGLRKSCRTYRQDMPAQETLAVIREFLDGNRTGPFGNPVRFPLITLDETEQAALPSFGTYGVIRGAPLYLAGVVRRGFRDMEDLGYAMEKNILKATALGLGTCWLGGTFRKAGFARRAVLGEDERLPVVSPLGYPAEKRSFVERAFRFVASSDRRKPWGSLFFLGDFETVLTEAEASSLAPALEAVRLGPSASNRQPWRVLKERERDVFHFYLKRTPVYDRMSTPVSLQEVDMGIAFCHFDLSAGERGWKGKWTVDDPMIPGANREYRATWEGEKNGHRPCLEGGLAEGPRIYTRGGDGGRTGTSG